MKMPLKSFSVHIFPSFLQVYSYIYIILLYVNYIVIYVSIYAHI